MPIAALMGDDHREMGKNDPKKMTRDLWEVLKKLGRRRITPKIQGRDLVFIALRSTEDEEEKIITKEGIKCFRPNDIKTLGIDIVANQTLHHLRNCQYIYISFDVDSLDTQYSVGTGTPVEDGLTIEQAKYLLTTFGKQDKLIGMEITEINPDLDTARPMQKVISQLIQNIFTHKDL
jgi:arginase